MLNIRKTVEMGSVDCVTHEHAMSVDGMDISVEEEIYDALLRKVRRNAV